MKLLNIKVNVALALKVTQEIGINRETALKGMYSATPDPGAMTEYSFNYNNKKIHFANAFAANDPVSTKLLWDNLLIKYKHCCKSILIVNCRSDREDRSAQLSKAITEWNQPSQIILIGSGTSIFKHYYEKHCIKYKVVPSKITSCEDKSATDIIKYAINLEYNSKELILVGVGNIAGIGLQLIDFCQLQYKNSGYKEE